MLKQQLEAQLNVRGDALQKFAVYMGTEVEQAEGDHTVCLKSVQSYTI